MDLEDKLEPHSLVGVERSSGYKRDLALISAAHAEAHAQTAIFPLVYPYAMESLGFGYVELSVLVGLTSLLGGLLQGVYGWLSRWVRRGILCGCGNLLIGVTLALAAFSRNFPMFAFARISSNVAASPQHPVAASLMSDWFGRRMRGSAFSIHFSGGNVGQVLAPLIGGSLLLLVGWRNTLIIFGLPGLLIGLLVLLLLRDSGKPDPPAHDKGGIGGGYLSTLHNRNVVMMFIAGSTTAGGRGLGIVLTFVPLYLVRGLNLNVTTTSVLFTILTAGGVLGPILTGWLADRIGSRKPIIIASLLGSLAATALLISSGHWLLGVLMSLLLLGLMVYNQGPLTQAWLADTVSRSEMENAFSLFFVITYVAGALWSLLIGLVLARWGFQAAFEVMIVSYLAASIVYMIIKEHASFGEPSLTLMD